MLTSTKLSRTLDKIFQTRQILRNRDTRLMNDRYEHFNAYARVYQMFRDNLMPIKNTDDIVIFNNNICNQVLFLEKFNTSDCIKNLSHVERTILNDVNNFSMENKRLIETNCDMILNDNIDHNNIHNISLLFVYFLKVISFVLIEWKYSPDENWEGIQLLNNKLQNFGDSYLFVQPYRHCGDYYANFMNNYYGKGRINELKQILDILKPYYLNLVQIPQ